MLKKRTFLILISVLLSGLSACVGGLWTGANMMYDRHGMYKKIDGYQLYMDVDQALAREKTFRCQNCVLDITVFKQDVLLTGHVPNEPLLLELRERLKVIRGYRRSFNYVRLWDGPSNAANDSWLTTKIRTKMFADSAIDPNAFKVVTTDAVVYLLGDVDALQAKKVIEIARNTEGVLKVVTLMKYMSYLSLKENTPSS